MPLGISAGQVAAFATVSARDGAVDLAAGGLDEDERDLGGVSEATARRRVRRCAPCSSEHGLSFWDD
jgi:hypothetical protein